MDGPIVRVADLHAHFAVRGSFADRLLGRTHGVVRAVDGVTLDIESGEVFGLVGESGSGKTTLGRTLLKLVEPTSGRVEFEGTDITRFDEDHMRPLRRRIQVVFQDPNASLNPAMRIVDAVAHPLKIHGVSSSAGASRTAVEEVLERVGLSPPAAFLDKYPDDLSGGQKQRVAIARALVTNPSFVVLDEPVAMLDMSVRARVLELLLQLRQELGLTYLFITHDLATAKFVCGRIAIMYLGRVAETGPAPAIYADPKHPYTQALLAAIPQPDPNLREKPVLPRGEIPDAVVPPRGCRFHPRCPQAVGSCGWEPRDLIGAIEDRWASHDLAAFDRERGILGELEAIRIEGDRVIVPAPGRNGEATALVAEGLGGERGMADAVDSIEETSEGVAVAFRPSAEPELREVAGRSVACVLYDEQRPLPGEKRRRSAGPGR